MATASSVPYMCIEISSDEDSENEDGASMGLNDHVAEELFEKLLHKGSVFGIKNENLQHLRNSFQKTSSRFLSGENFVTFMYNVLLRIKRDNALQIFAEVDRCLCSEEIDKLSQNGARNGATPNTPRQVKTSSTQFRTDLEDAKLKLIEFFNSRTSKNSIEQTQTDDWQTKRTKNTLFSNGDCDNVMPIEHDAHNFGTSNGVHLQNTEPLAKLRKLNDGTHGKEQHLISIDKSKTNMNIINDNAQHCSISTATSTKSDAAENLKHLEKPEDNGSSNTMTCTNSESRTGTCSADENEITIISVIEHSNSKTGPHSYNSTQATVPKSNYCVQHETDDSSTLQGRELKRQLLIRSLKKRLRFYDKEIKRLMATELTLDEMDSEDSTYIQESKLKEKYYKLYKQLCKIKGSKDTFDDKQYSRIKIEGAPYPEINREAQKFLQKRKKFPDFIDVKRLVSHANSIYSLGLTTQNEQSIAKHLFTEIGNKLQHKRKIEFTKYSGSFLTDDASSATDPALGDHDLSKQLKRNKKISKSKTDEVFNYFSWLEIQGNENDSDVDNVEDDVRKAVQKGCKRATLIKVEEGSIVPNKLFEMAPSNGENHTASITTTVSETSIPNSADNSTSNTADSKNMLCEVGIPEQSGKPCQENCIRGPDSPTDNIPAVNGTVVRKAQEEKHLNDIIVIDSDDED